MLSICCVSTSTICSAATAVERSGCACQARDPKPTLWPIENLHSYFVSAAKPAVASSLRAHLSFGGGTLCRAGGLPEWLGWEIDATVALVPSHTVTHLHPGVGQAYRLKRRLAS
jgi:hypothetical protein